MQVVRRYLRVRVLLQVGDDLLGGDTAAEGSAHGLAGQDAHHHVREPERHRT